MHLVLEDPSECFSWAYVPSLQVFINLIICIADSQGCAIRTLVNVLVNVLYGGNTMTAFDIDMSIELFGEVGVVGDNPPVIKLM